MALLFPAPLISPPAVLDGALALTAFWEALAWDSAPWSVAAHCEDCWAWPVPPPGLLPCVPAIAVAGRAIARALTPAAIHFDRMLLSPELTCRFTTTRDAEAKQLAVCARGHRDPGAAAGVLDGRPDRG